MNERSSAPQLKVTATKDFPGSTRLLKRKCACGQHSQAGEECEECRKKREGTLQRAAASTAPTSDVPPIVHDVLNSPGQALDAGTRAFMQPHFAYDFSGVRVHTDARATESAQAVNALAYTVGRDVVFGPGQYSPETMTGKRLLAHELTHVVQQSHTTSQGIQRAEADNPSKTASQPVAKGADTADADIDALDLAPNAKKAAKKLKEEHPDITFTSGRRNVTEQAHAMASNIVSSKNRKWIEQTYASAAKLQQWVDNHPDTKTVDDIAKGLETVMNEMSESERGKVSKHLSGEAFDVQPRERDADTIKKDIRNLPGITKFLEKEGGLVRWHAQFKKIEGISQSNDKYEQEADRVAEEVVFDDHFTTNNAGVKIREGSPSSIQLQGAQLPQAPRSLECKPPAGSPYSLLPAELRKTLCVSFDGHGKSGIDPENFWGMGNAKTVWDALDNLGTANVNALAEVYQNVKQVGMPWSFIHSIRNVWPGTARGFNFNCEEFGALEKWLENDKHFCKDTRGGKLFHEGDCWREVKSVVPGLHVCLLAAGPQTIHIDLHQAVELREENGYCNYDITGGAREHWQDILEEKLGNPKLSIFERFEKARQYVSERKGKIRPGSTDEQDLRRVETWLNKSGTYMRQQASRGRQGESQATREAQQILEKIQNILGRLHIKVLGPDRVNFP